MQVKHDISGPNFIIRVWGEGAGPSLDGDCLMQSLLYFFPFHPNRRSQLCISPNGSMQCF